MNSGRDARKTVCAGLSFVNAERSKEARGAEACRRALRVIVSMTETGQKAPFRSAENAQIANRGLKDSAGLYRRKSA
jgi:hypothetical protein